MVGHLGEITYPSVSFPVVAAVRTSLRRLGAVAASAMTSASWPSRRRDEWTIRAVIIALLAVLTWPVLDFLPANGLDPSWIAGVHMAADGQGPSDGSALIFTYGPLGFLLVPQLWVGWTFALSLVVTLLIHVALVALVVIGVRRSFPWVWAVVIAYVLLMLAAAPSGAAPSRVFVLVVLLALWVSLSAWKGAWSWLAPVLLGMGAGVLAVANFGMGVSALLLFALASVAAVATRRYLPAAIMVGTAAIGIVGAWVVVQGSINGLWRWMRLSVDVVTGYPAAMAMQSPSTDWYWLVVLPLVVAMGFQVTWLAQGLPRSRWVPVALVVGLAAFLLVQKHMTRSGAGHVLPLIFALAAMVVSLPVERRRLAVPSLAAAFGILAMWVALPTALTKPLDLGPSDRVQALASQVRAAVDGDRRPELMEQARTAMLGIYAMSPGVRAALGDQPVFIDPTEVAAAWALGLNWEPVPVFQPYAAYTRSLDEANARAVDDGRAQRVLVERNPEYPDLPGTGLDGRRLDADSPAYSLAIVCNFAPIAQDERWTVLARVPRRCGAARGLGPVVQGRDGEPVAVPRAPHADAVVVARISARLPLRARVASRLWVPRWIPTITLNGGPVFRYLLNTGESTWMMRVPPSLAPSLRDPAVAQVDSFTLAGVDSPFDVRFEWIPTR